MDFEPDTITGEQVLSFTYEPGIFVHINAPAPEKFMRDRPAALIFYALPNGNTTAQTIGKILQPGDDWHFDIQHTGAQTRFLREETKDYNFIVVYLETAQKSWPSWKSSNSNYTAIVKCLSDSLIKIFHQYDPFIILSGHSGGGRFIFSFLDAYEEIPPSVKRICFLDSNYGYEKDYSKKITTWLKSSADHYLSVLAYNDSNVTLNGKPIVSPTGGTWHRSRMMADDLSEDFIFNVSDDENFIIYKAYSGRINFLLKKNTDARILHTVQVERNGFIHSILLGTQYENRNYFYFGERAYSKYIYP